MSARNREWPHELNTLMGKAIAIGATIRRGKHFIVTLPNGLGSVVLPVSPSDRRTYLNCTAQLRRALAGHYRKGNRK